MDRISRGRVVVGRVLLLVWLLLMEEESNTSSAGYTISVAISMYLENGKHMLSPAHLSDFLMATPIMWDRSIALGPSAVAAAAA